MHYAALICSRQQMLPTGETDWVRATVRAVRTLTTDQEYGLICSLGTASYEMALALAVGSSLPVKLLLTPHESKSLHHRESNLEKYLSQQFSLPPKQMILELISANTTPGCDLQHLRDHLILEQATELYPTSIRPEGFFARQLESGDYNGKINRRFETPYAAGQKRLSHNFEHRKLCKETAKALDGRITHWTRTAVRPNEALTAGEFYRKIACSGAEYAHSAERILRKILTGKVLRASGRHQLKHQPMVALSSAPLSNAVSLMRYRRRYREMSFEPFGISLPLAAAKHMGIRRVSYVPDEEYKLMPQSERLFAHRAGIQGADWPAECEWRSVGDISLLEVMSELIALTETKAQAKKISAEFDVTALPVFAD